MTFSYMYNVFPYSPSIHSNSQVAPLYFHTFSFQSYSLCVCVMSFIRVVYRLGTPLTVVILLR